jgi:hypothetical protein
MLGATCGIAVVSAITLVSAQSNSRVPRESVPVRHLVYIATPGDNDTDNQSGIVVLDADKDYSFLKRISYDLPASTMPGPKVSGITVSLPLQILYVTTDGYIMAFDLATDKIAWTFNGETGPVPRTVSKVMTRSSGPVYGYAATKELFAGQGVRGYRAAER